MSSPMPDYVLKTELSESVTVSQYLDMENARDKEGIAQFIQERFRGRYISPVNPPGYSNWKRKSGFTMMAVGCLMIEALESFRNGWNDTSKDAKHSDGTKMKGGEIFDGFFDHYDAFSDFRSLGKKFYKHIRCGLLHQAETTGGWRISRKVEDDLLNAKDKVINATKFMKALDSSLAEYCDELRQADWEDDIWENTRNKIGFVIKNCKS